MEDRISMNVEGKDVDAFLAVPDGPGPFPGIVVAHHGPGLDRFTDKVVDQLAAAGYVTLAPNFYHRGPGDLPIPDKVAALRDVEILADIAAGVSHLRARDDVDDRRLAIVGHCLGGRNSLLGAVATDHFSACVIFYGGHIMKGRGRENPTPFDLLEHLSCPVIGFFGNEDDNPSPADVDKIDAEMTRLGIAHQFHRYDETGHAFQNFVSEERYRPRSSDDAQAKLLAFLKRTLSS